MPLERSVRTSAAKASARTDMQALIEKEPMMMVASAAGAEIRTGPIIARRQPPKPNVPTKPMEGTKPKRAFSSTASSQFRSKVSSISYTTGNHGKVTVKDLGRALPFIAPGNHLPFAINQIDSDDSEIGPTQATQILPSRVRVQSQSYLSGHHQGGSTKLSQRRPQPNIASSESLILPESTDYPSYLRRGKPVSRF
ncbi:MAG: hypothetical protein M1835_007760 [Candelina submexicana]|nr:MAG: hypothetical protein M1835_007760 [Candelina submexicana]